MIGFLVIALVLLALVGTGLSGPARAGAGHFASGHGNLVMEGTLRTFTFQARASGDGNVRGSMELKNRHLGVRAHADLDCLRIEGDEAFLSGTLSQVEGIDGSIVGDAVWFHIKDNGEGRGDPADRISLVIVEVLSTPSELFTCDTPLSVILAAFPEQADDLELMDIIGGNVQVR